MRSELMKDFFLSFNGSEKQHEKLVAWKGLIDLHSDWTLDLHSDWTLELHSDWTLDLHSDWTLDTAVTTTTVITTGKGEVKSVLQSGRYRVDTRRVCNHRSKK
jgi:hypothetical protein